MFVKKVRQRLEVRFTILFIHVVAERWSSGTAMRTQKTCLYALLRVSSRQCSMPVVSFPTTSTTFSAVSRRMVKSFISIIGQHTHFSGSGAVYSFDSVGSYEREACRAAGAASALVQPFLDNQVRVTCHFYCLSGPTCLVFLRRRRTRLASLQAVSCLRRVSFISSTVSRFICGPEIPTRFYFILRDALNLLGGRVLHRTEIGGRKSQLCPLSSSSPRHLYPSGARAHHRRIFAALYGPSDPYPI
jgi:hypothetical protein